MHAMTRKGSGGAWTEGPRAAHSAGPHAQDAPGYYGLPALKASHWRWMVAAYIFVAGIAGSVQIYALLLLLWQDGAAARASVGPARWIALVCVLAGAGWLIADLKTPRRYYQMLRILRITSPMSIGTYVLLGFGGLSGLLALLQLGIDLDLFGTPRWLELLLQAGCAAFGLFMCSYTAPLLSATSTPLWAKSPRLLGGSFASYSMASGAGVLSLALLLLPAGLQALKPALERIAVLGLLATALCVLFWLWQIGRAGLARPLFESPGHAALLLLGAIGLGLLLPLGLHALPPIAGALGSAVSATAAAAELAGSLAWRAVLLFAGHDSALRTEDALGSTRAWPAASPSAGRGPSS